MRKQSILLLTAAALLCGSSLHAGTHKWEVTASAVRADARDTTQLGDGESVDFKSANGYGASLNMFWTDRFSTELAASRTSPEVRNTIEGVDTVSFGKVDMTPISAALQFHLLPGSRIDPYIGAGGAYVMFDDSKTDLTELGVDRFGFKDEFGPMGQAGVRVGLWHGVGLNVDAKYIALKAKTDTRLTGGETTEQVDVKINPLILSAGVSFRF